MKSRFASAFALALTALASTGCPVVTDVPLGADEDGGKDGMPVTPDSGSADGGVLIDSATADFDGGELVDTATADFDGGELVDTATADFDGGEPDGTPIDWDGGVAVDSATGDWDGGVAVDGSIDWDGGASTCADPECGPSSGAPSCLCSDGSLGCNTGRCLRNFAGTCGWEYRVCP
ncbi:MAG: hypothetical protein ACXWVM_41350 [Polyangiales bacterium]